MEIHSHALMTKFSWKQRFHEFFSCFLILCIPVLGSQILTGCWLSLDPDAKRPLVGCQSTHFTSAPWPLRTLSSIQLKKSQTRTVPSSEHDANLASVGLKLTDLTGSLWAWNILTLFMLDCQYLMKPPWSPEKKYYVKSVIFFFFFEKKMPVTIQVSLCDHFIARIEVSWACKMVSKLKVNPFQSVNSPLEAPVINLLPSGVQSKVKMGHLILFVAVFTNFVVTALTGFSGASTGGRRVG